MFMAGMLVDGCVTFHLPTPGTPTLSDADRRSSERTRLSIDAVMDLSVVDPVRDEELFVEGLRRLVQSFVT
jgi:hypothetical protein